MNKIHLELDLSEARLVIESCRVLEAQWGEMARKTQDEDEQADLSNDAGHLASLRRYIEQVAVEGFGPEAQNFSREPAY